MNIVFVCTSNTCRSPVSQHFAIEYFRRKLNMTVEQLEEKGIIIRSAALTNVFDPEGSSASKYSVDVMKKYQLDLSNHRSQLLTEKMCLEADYVVCVATGMTYKVMEKFPRIKERDGVLCTFSRDLPDPWHMSYDTYMENIAQNEELTREFLDRHPKPNFYCDIALYYVILQPS
ncbi:Phosphotyrosine protein phosphatase I superfamily [Plasmopara halstedii]|uniref:Phosphotyrosine protein phosphatase I superfamily n=1 Tax=Plasmopara halstedii TaxID=4781 RepID=A0A0P1AYR5_PLAHL|nr:Phosphotyrosine protein phosphatase I superfamily [Plasmopara halstedii]CEG46316.1 Phosphotyrosine protein phosphatase I superfamily [Plasmopara halstedii]|eukprot:XP_024582685.1 Phosphotyrosine protein phosphatase I superfamily [Plasmopara halstedii]